MEEAAVPPPPAPAPALVQQPPASSWSSILQNKPAAKPLEEISSRVFGSRNSSKGIAVAVVDANAIINGGRLVSSADKFVSVREVLDEVRDPASRHRLSFLPFPIETMEPSPEFIKKVVKFARETGDLQTLSDVDIKLIALTYMLEAQIHGTSHLRESLPPLHVVNVKHLPEAEMPGWGSNVPNLAEWEVLEQIAENGSNHGSRILPLKDLDDNVIPMPGSGTKPEGQVDEHQSFGRRRRFLFPKKEIKLEGRKMVADGIDASLGEDTENADDWRPAVSRSTHRRYLRRKARCELAKAAEENGHPSGEASLGAATTGGDDICSDGESECTDFIEHKSSEETHTENDELKVGKSEESDFSAVQEHMMLEFNAYKPSQEEKEDDDPSADTAVSKGSSSDVATATEVDEIGDLTSGIEGDKIDMCTKELDNLEITSVTDGSVDTSYIDDGCSEQSWMLRPLSDSTVACVTSDYAMQNVILQIGLRLLAPGGMQIRQLHRYDNQPLI
ncbi:putative RNA-binding protein NOB1 [Cocos nucifera]|uniref:Putative RNA-binding protein NOB1 n=1 Tax=Cocos nucifera TaxID=13894 RepID=A0A8K0IKF0_COCNU|nr:putative RNA-binding protein NOB1 [Cocos nucifera]